MHQKIPAALASVLLIGAIVCPAFAESADHGLTDPATNHTLPLLVMVLSLALLVSLFALARCRIRRKEMRRAYPQEDSRSRAMLIRQDPKANEMLAVRNRELNEIAKMLVRRDLDLNEANMRLQELDRTKSEFVSIAAHQLRTPLTGIRWSYFALLDRENGPLTEVQRQIVTDALSAILRAVELVNNLLNVARIEEGRFGFVMRRQALLPLMIEAHERYLPVAEKKQITFKIMLPAHPGPELMIDEEKIMMLFDILIDNALKYTKPGGHITLRLATLDTAVRIDVEDIGIGIPQAQAERIFTKFFRADNAQLFETSGSGLGLYVAKNIVERHRGTIRFSNNEPAGTIFSVTLPLMPVEPSVAPAVEPSGS